MASRTSHMHTVPRGYLAGFADRSAPRDKPHVWRFERRLDEPKLISVRNVSVRRDIYALWTAAGVPDISIETELLSKTVDDGFPELIALLESGQEPSYWGWRRLSRFIAFQLVRTPRSFQMHRDACARAGLKVGRNDPQLGMVYMAPIIENWICQLKWFILWNRTDFAFLTSDNPVTTWADRGSAFETGVGFVDPALRVLFPLSPKICVATVQTRASWEAITGESPEREGSFTEKFELSIQSAALTVDGVIRHNQVTTSNAEKYAYATRNEDRLQLFMRDWFTERPAPVRRDDHQPIGSPLGVGRRQRTHDDP